MGGIVVANELRKYGYDVLLVSQEPPGGHRMLSDAPYVEDVELPKLTDGVDFVGGFFDGQIITSGNKGYRVEYKHLVLSTGGVELPVVFPKSEKADVRPAVEILKERPQGLKIIVWGTTEWGFRTALSLSNLGNDVIILDNSAHFRDVKYYRKRGELLIKRGVEILTSATIKKYEDGELAVEVNLGKRGVEKRRIRTDVVVSAVRAINTFIPYRMGLKLFYSFELGSLIVRRNYYGELLKVDEEGRATGGIGAYAVGELYGAYHMHIVERQARLLAAYVAFKDGIENESRVRDLLDEFLAYLSVEANWLYNLGYRLEHGTDETGRYVEPNVIDVPHWAYFWPQLKDVDPDQELCPCIKVKLGELLKEISRRNRRELRMRITHDETNLLRQLKTPTVDELFGANPCIQTYCITSITLILSALLAQKPSYFIYGKTEQLYSEI